MRRNGDAATDPAAVQPRSRMSSSVATAQPGVNRSRAGRPGCARSALVSDLGPLLAPETHPAGRPGGPARRGGGRPRVDLPVDLASRVGDDGPMTIPSDPRRGGRLLRAEGSALLPILRTQHPVAFDKPTLLPGWSVRDVLAHCSAALKMASTGQFHDFS